MKWRVTCATLCRAARREVTAMRKMRVIGVGVSDESGRPWVRVASDATIEEQNQLLKLGQTSVGAVYGRIIGIPDDKAAALKPGDVLTCSEVSVKISKSVYTDKKTNLEKEGLDVAMFLSGKVSREAAPVAECDW